METNKIDRIVEKIAEITFKRYGRNVMFREYNFKFMTFEKSSFLFRTQSAINYPYLYEIQLHLFDKISAYSSIGPSFKKCMHCGKRKPEYKMKCCGKYTHFECAHKNNFSCCHVNQCLHNATLNECCVCLNNTTSVTQCMHHLCYTCLGEMNKKMQNAVLACPMCRQPLIENTKTTDFKNVILDGSDEVICVSII